MKPNHYQHAHAVEQDLYNLFVRMQLARQDPGGQGAACGPV